MGCSDLSVRKAEGQKGSLLGKVDHASEEADLEVSQRQTETEPLVP
jgi:hypothetical protein